jgi:aspartyl-tRNA(Asn)/glutamyl-tRNA(Gln) amidotransferase subunit A
MADVVEALGVAVGPEPSDLRSLPSPEASWLAALDDPRPPAKVAWSPTLGYATVDRQVMAACERAVGVLADLGAEVSEVKSVFDDDPFSLWISITQACNHRAIGHLRGTEAWERVEPALRNSVEEGERRSARQLIEALDECHRLNWRLVQLFRGVQLLVTPTCAGPPPRSGQPGTIDGQPTRDWVQFTYPFNMTRSPAASVCAGFTDDGLPIGIQLVGPQQADLVVIRAAAALERALGLDAVAAGWEA